MMRMRWAALVGAATMSFGACADDQPAPPPEGMTVHLFGPNPPNDPFSGVGHIILKMTGDGLEQPLTTTADYVPGGSASLDLIPFSAPGQKRTLVVEGWTDAGGKPGFLLSRGRAKPLEVRIDSAEAELDVLLGKVNSFLPLISSNTKASQQLTQGRIGHAVAVGPNEIVVLGGGIISNPSTAWWGGSGYPLLSSVEAIDLQTFEVSPRPDMKLERVWHTASTLSSGQIIIAGGYDESGQASSTVELYNPPGVLNGEPVALLPMRAARAAHTATLISDETRQILFVGGDSSGTWELWDPVNGSPDGTKPLLDGLPRRHHTATTFFLEGRSEPAVLITGGETGTTVHSTAMLYDSVANQMVPISDAMPGGARTQHTAVFVPGRNFIYIAGGFTDVNRTSATASIDVFDVGRKVNDQASPGFVQGNGAFRMRTARGGQAAALLPDNVVVMAGGAGAEGTSPGFRPLGSLEVIHEFVNAETFTLEIQVASSYTGGGLSQVPYLPTDRIGHRIVALDSGMALVIGGAAPAQSGGGYQLIRELSLYNPQ